MFFFHEERLAEIVDVILGQIKKAPIWSTMTKPRPQCLENPLSTFHRPKEDINAQRDYKIKKPDENSVGLPCPSWRPSLAIIKLRFKYTQRCWCCQDFF
jgi:hypothetical protein